MGEYKYRPNEAISTAQASFAKEGLVFLSGACGLYLVASIFVEGLKSRYGDLKDYSIFAEGLKFMEGLKSRCGDIKIWRGRMLTCVTLMMYTVNATTFSSYPVQFSTYFDATLSAVFGQTTESSCRAECRIFLLSRHTIQALERT